jgi:hypothetical protein
MLDFENQELRKQVGNTGVSPASAATTLQGVHLQGGSAASVHDGTSAMTEMFDSMHASLKVREAKVDSADKIVVSGSDLAVINKCCAMMAQSTAAEEQSDLQLLGGSVQSPVFGASVTASAAALSGRGGAPTGPPPNLESEGKAQAQIVRLEADVRRLTNEREEARCLRQEQQELEELHTQTNIAVQRQLSTIALEKMELLQQVQRLEEEKAVLELESLAPRVAAAAATPRGFGRH